MASPRLGVETEFHGMFMTFCRTDVPVGYGTFWPMPVPPLTEIDKTMMQHDPVLIPRTGDAALFSSLATIPWQGDWGFVVSGDRFAALRRPLVPGGPDVTAGSCALETGSGAHDVGDAYHWVFHRRCTKALRDTLLEFRTGENRTTPGMKEFFADIPVRKRWYPISDIIDRYNAKVDALPVPIAAPGLPVPPTFNVGARDRFKLRESVQIEQLRQGTHANYAGQHWTAYVSVDDGLRCDSQVNYFIGLGNLWNHTPTWLDLWKNMWIEALLDATHPVDPLSGFKPPVVDGRSLPYAYRNQITKAMWTFARAEATRLLAAHPIPDAHDTVQNRDHVCALLMVTIVFGAITPVASGSTQKNSYSQLCKTSPASIAQTIGIPNLFASPAAKAAVRVAAAALRNMVNLVGPEGGLPACPPGALPPPGLPQYPAYNDPMLSTNLPAPGFDAMFDAMFSSAITIPPPALAVVAPANQWGLTTVAPFGVYWAGGVHSGARCERDADGEIYALFESRFSFNRLNFGFNPDVRDDAFYFAYIKLMDALIPGVVVSRSKLNAQENADIISTRMVRETVQRALDTAQVPNIH